MRYSILDVAARAGVSKSTVSRVMNSGSVSEKARKAVIEAIEEMQFRPNATARGLRGARCKIIGIASLSTNVFQEMSLTNRLAGMNSVLLNAGYSALLINYDGSSNETISNKAFRFLEENRIDGLIFIGTVESEMDLECVKRNREVVYTGERMDLYKGFRVYLGNYNYSRDLYYYLFSSGHKKILTLSSHEFGSKSIIQRRAKAYEEVCNIFNTSADLSSIINLSNASLLIAEQLNVALDLFINGKYTAIFADSLELANRIISYFASKDLKILRDYSIVAIERTRQEGSLDNLITSVCLPDYLYGEESAKLMLEVLANPNLSYKDVIIPYTFEVRNSVRNIITL